MMVCVGFLVLCFFWIDDELSIVHMACWIVMHVCFVFFLLRTLLHVVWIGGP